MNTHRFVTYLNDELAAAMTSRANPARGVTVAETGRRALSRYLLLVEHGRQTLAGRLTPDELRLIAEAAASFSGNDYTVLVQTGQGMVGSTAAAVMAAKQALFRRRRVDREHLLTLLCGVSVPEDLALIDACERFWAGSAGTDPADMLDAPGGSTEDEEE